MKAFALSLLATTVLVTPAFAKNSESDAAVEEVQSDTGESGISEIIVTAQRRSETLQKVPLAVTAFDSAALTARGITSLAKLSDSVVPGLVATPFAGAPSFSTFAMRGIAAPDPGTGLNELGVSIYTDGIPLGRAVGTGIDLGDIERIEVLRGPQGTLFGRNAEGGAIQFVTRRPTGEAGARAELSYGNYDAVRALAHIDLPSIGNLSFKLSSLINRRNGFTKNAPLRAFDTLSAADQNDFGFFDQKGFRVAALWSPSADFNAYYTFDFADTKSTNTYQVRTGGRTPAEPAFCAVPNFKAFCATPASIGANIFQGTRQPDVGYPEQSRFPMATPLNNTRIRGHGLTLNWTASDALTIKAITGYRTLKENSLNNLGDALAFVQFVPSSFFDGTAPDVPVGTRAAVSGSMAVAAIDQDQFSQELQFLVDWDSLRLTAGLFYFHENVIDTRSTLFNLSFNTTSTPGVLTGVSVQPFALQVNPVTGVNASRGTFDATANSYAAYMQGTWTPAALERLHITGGLRFTHDKKVFLRTEFGGAPGNLSSTFSASRFDPAFIVAFDVSDDINLYAKYSSAYRAGGVNIRDRIALSPYNEEVNKAFEIGFKSQLFDRKVRWNIAAFRSRVSGTQTAAPNTPADPSSQSTLNLPDVVKFHGVESELTVAPVRGIQLGVNYAYLDSEGPLTITTAGVTSFYRIPYAPKHTLQLTGDFQLPLRDEMRLVGHVDYNYMSANTANPLQNTTRFSQAAGQTLRTTNLRLGVEDIAIGGAKIAISGFARNIFDTQTYSFAYQTGTNDFTKAGQPGGAAALNDPRTYGIELRVKI